MKLVVINLLNVSSIYQDLGYWRTFHDKRPYHTEFTHTDWKNTYIKKNENILYQFRDFK
jgi:hypothetical protein